MEKHNLVFLHGLLGDKNDWQAVVEILAAHPDYHCITLDLPFHGENNTVVENFEQTSQWLSQHIQQHLANQAYTLIGYSLGGRIATYFALQQQVPTGNLHQVILEGANLGLEDPQQRQVRWQNDLTWARRFRSEPLVEVLDDWYQQPVFNALSAKQRIDLKVKRAKNEGQKVAAMLLATSLAKQPEFSQQVHLSQIKFHYICGQNDTKFRTIACNLGLSPNLIQQAGHNAHRDNPVAFASKLLEIMNTSNQIG